MSKPSPFPRHARRAVAMSCALLGAIGPAIGACAPKSGDDDSGTPAERAARRYAEHCAPCHGDSGDGQGPVAMTLDPPPRDFRDAAWQASVTDDHLRAAITNGGAGVGKSALMPAYPAFKADAELLAALIARLRAFQRP